ncbi:uncharacterized protein LOC143888830 [Tasmannia lanceolata]|uniref:uncharacterized protein LOC143888830 n=1 Tax=Tasmannia lanceolata TaxID=3420 RepID=UPI004063ECDC
MTAVERQQFNFVEMIESLGEETRGMIEELQERVQELAWQANRAMVEDLRTQVETFTGQVNLLMRTLGNGTGSHNDGHGSRVWVPESRVWVPPAMAPHGEVKEHFQKMAMTDTVGSLQSKNQTIFCQSQYQSLLILFASQQIGVAFVLTQPKPNEETADWDNADYIWKNHLLNGLSNELYNVYYSYEHAADLWNAIVTKYELEDAGNRKYVIGNCLDFTMEDGKHISAQIDEYQFIIGELAKEGMKLPDTFVAGSLIEKLPLENRLKDKQLKAKEYTSKANIIETKNDGSKNLKPKKDKNFKKSGPKKKGVCFECGKPEHYKKDCRHRKTGSSSAKVNLTEADMIAAVVTEVNLVGNSKE